MGQGIGVRANGVCLFRVCLVWARIAGLKVGDVEPVIPRIDDALGEQLLQPRTLSAWIESEEIADGTGYELWLITSKIKDGITTTIERPVLLVAAICLLPPCGKPGIAPDWDRSRADHRYRLSCPLQQAAPPFRPHSTRN